MKSKFTLAAILSALALGSYLAPLPAAAQTAGSGFIVNTAYNKCLDFSAGNLSNSVTLQLWSCGGNAATNQQWFFHHVGYYPNNTPAYLFQNAQNFTCVAVENDSLLNAARIVQRPCDSSNPSQHWILTAQFPLTSKTRWMNGRSGKCLDAWSNNNGTVLQQYTCAGSSNWGPQGFRQDIYPSGT